MNVVACLYWSGVFKNRENVYTTEWVYILRNMGVCSLSALSSCVNYLSKTIFMVLLYEPA